MHIISFQQSATIASNPFSFPLSRGRRKYNIMETKAPTGLDRKIADSYKHIEGWGIDAVPENDPTYPMKHYTGADHDRLNYERAPQQKQDIELLKSNERPTITRVFGTSVPPSGLSGMLRRFAFRFSEGSSGHWL